MTVKTTYYTAELVAITCGSCGVPFGLTDDFIAERQKSHATFYCPNGHHRYYPAENAEEKFKRLYKQESDRATRLLAERDQAEASRRAWKGQATKARNRAAAGTCPFCGQHLRDLERHIGRQHPEQPVEMTEADASS